MTQPSIPDNIKPAWCVPVLLLAAWLIPGKAQAADPIKVTYLSPGIERQFWHDSIDIMQAAANDLGIDLKVVISSDANYRVNRDGRAALNAAEKPDYFVSGYWRDVTVALLKIAETKNIKTVLFNAPIAEAEKKPISRPRKNFKNWILHLRPDDTTGSYELTQYLLTQAQQNAATEGETPGIIALSGNPEATVAVSRNLGFRSALHTFAGFKLLEFVYCDWKKDLAEKMTQQYLQAHPQIKVIWTASDSMALGAINAIQQSGKTPGKDILTGGFDWSLEALQAIKTKEIAASMGGHILEAAWSMILIHDYHHGIDIADDPGTEVLTQLEMITAENVEHYLPILTNPYWNDVDFKQFSKVYNKSLKKYDFSFKAIAAQLQSK
jgi:ABC-type sugar transport system substrate-binding protein